MNLNEVYDHLIDAQDHVTKDRMASAKMSFMAVQRLLTPYLSNQYARFTIFKIATIRNKMDRYKIYSDERVAIADEIELMLAQCIYEMGNRCAA